MSLCGQKMNLRAIEPEDLEFLFEIENNESFWEVSHTQVPFSKFILKMKIKKLISEGRYDGVVFHRVIDGFMAQTGDVQFGNSDSEDYDLRRAGTGGSGQNIDQEFNDTPHSKGTLSMARSSDPNSADSQFFICFDDAPHLDGQYTAWGQVVEGMEFVDMIKKGDPMKNGSVDEPDKIMKMWID